MHPALRKGSLFYNEHPHFPTFFNKNPTFHFFTKKNNPPISFPAYGPGENNRCTDLTGVIRNAVLTPDNY